jgi:hypothetical protein
MNLGMETGYRISGIKFFDDDEDETNIRFHTVSGTTLDEAFNKAIQICIDAMNSYGFPGDPEDDPNYQKLTDIFGRSKEEVERERTRRENEPPVGAGEYAWYNEPDNWRLEPQGGSRFLLVPGEGEDEAWDCVVEKLVNGKNVPLPEAELNYYVNRS